MENSSLIPKALENQPSDNAILWKYMSFQKFTSFILNRQFYYSRLDQLEDTLEGINQRVLSMKLFNDKMEEDEFINTNHPYYEKLMVGSKRKIAEEKFITNQRNKFVLCWITNDRESAGMWNLYSEPGGVAIKIQYHAMIDTLNNNSGQFDTKRHIKSIEYGTVVYKDYLDSWGVSLPTFRVKNNAFRKDKSFSHENEFRVCIQMKNIIALDTVGVKQNLVDFEKIPIQVVLHPKSTQWQIENVRKMVKEFAPSFKVKNSELKLR